MTRSRVDLPAPLGPTRPKICPAGTWRLRSSRAGAEVRGKRMVTPMTVRAGGAAEAGAGDGAGGVMAIR